MTRWLVAYFVTAVVFVAADLVWLTSVGQSIYRPAVKELFTPDLRYAPAIAFYVVYVFGVVVLAVIPGVRADAPLVGAAQGAVLGFVAYATYDLTNMATLKVWPLHVALLDMAWGSFLTAVAAAAGCWAMLRVAP